MKVTESSWHQISDESIPAEFRVGLPQQDFCFSQMADCKMAKTTLLGGSLTKGDESFIQTTWNGLPVRMRMDTPLPPHILHWSDFKDIRSLYCSCHTTFSPVITNLEFSEKVPHFKIFYRVNPRGVCLISKINMWWNHARSREEGRKRRKYRRKKWLGYIGSNLFCRESWR